MKIPNEVRLLYEDYKSNYQRLSELVGTLLSSKKDRRWHYESRVKTLESYAIKLETGRHKSNIEDFFACTLVVENLQARSKAEELINAEFKLHQRRPPLDSATHKGSDSFPFDDLRLYVSWKDLAGSRPSGLSDIVFEVQIKTFLQHAWAIATHDMIYKSSEKSWAKERIAYQIKAMLEHAEISILEADAIAKSDALQKSNKETDRVIRIIAILKRFWEEDKLPSDINRLANNIISLITSLNLTEDDLTKIIENEILVGKGSESLNLSPFGATLQSIINQKKDTVISYLLGKEKRYKLFITKDLDLPSEINLSESKNVIFPWDRA